MSHELFFEESAVEQAGQGVCQCLLGQAVMEPVELLRLEQEMFCEAVEPLGRAAAADESAAAYRVALAAASNTPTRNAAVLFQPPLGPYGLIAPSGVISTMRRSQIFCVPGSLR